MRVMELFGGIGAVRKAFIRAGLPYEGVSYVESDPKCVASYNALYGTDFAPIDIRTFSPPDVPVDFLMHSSPCQDVSRAGAKRGARPGSGTRSSLLFETVRVLGEMDPPPTWVVFENVKGMLDGPAGDAFITYLEAMEALGYETSYAVLNAMDFGIPQKRERLFAVSHLGKAFSFQALERIPMRPLTDFLQADADPRYIVRQPSMLRRVEDTEATSSFCDCLHVIEDYAYTVSTRQMRCPNAGLIALPGGKYRYLTERECLYLMGFGPRDVDILEAVHPRRKNQTSSILYRQAGNSIVVDVLMAILKEIAKEEQYGQTF